MSDTSHGTKQLFLGEAQLQPAPHNFVLRGIFFSFFASASAAKLFGIDHTVGELLKGCP